MKIKSELFLLAYLAVFFLIYGGRFMNPTPLLSLSRNLYTPLHDPYQFLHGSLLGPFITHYLGLRSLVQLYGFYILAIIACFISFHFIILKFIKDKKTLENYISIFAVLACTPLIHVLFSWIGNSDPLIILAYLGFVFSSTRITKNASVFLLLLAHRQIGLIILCIHLLLHWREKKEEWKDVIPGVFLAFIVHGLYMYTVGHTQTRELFALGYVHNFFQPYQLIMLVLFGFSWFWIVLGKMIIQKPRIELFISIIIIVAAAFFTDDKTRVASLLVSLSI